MGPKNGRQTVNMEATEPHILLGQDPVPNRATRPPLKSIGTASPEPTAQSLKQFPNFSPIFKVGSNLEFEYDSLITTCRKKTSRDA